MNMNKALCKNLQNIDILDRNKTKKVWCMYAILKWRSLAQSMRKKLTLRKMSLKICIVKSF